MHEIRSQVWFMCLRKIASLLFFFIIFSWKNESNKIGNLLSNLNIQKLQ